MKIDAPWRCDKCNRLKEPTNGWLVGATYVMGTLPKESFIGFTVVAWDDELADRQDSAHLCGVECGQKWTTEQMGKLVNRN